jgi:hypothetical protein
MLNSREWSKCLKAISSLTEKKYVKNVQISIVKTGSNQSNITYLFSLISKHLIRRFSSLQVSPNLLESLYVVRTGVPHTPR